MIGTTLRRSVLPILAQSLLTCFPGAPVAQAADLSVTNTDDGGNGSLRQAILDSNASAAVLDAIRFDIPGVGVHTISPASPLPTITDPVVLDGATQPGFAGTPLIELDGSGAGGGSGLRISAGGSTVRGLAINRFALYGIHLENKPGNFVERKSYGLRRRGL